MSKYLEANKIVREKYLINSVMGENPVGITYGGVDTLTGQKIVVKEFFPANLCERIEDSAMVAGKEGFQERKEQFIRESQIVKENRGLEGIVDVLEVFEENGTAYAIMEYVEGVSLEKYLSGSGKQFPVKRIKELMAPVMDSLAMLHGKGLVHQNISPDNLIFTNKGNLKLIGFGCITGCISDAGAMYAPIELHQKQPITPGTDVYSLCATIYRCITGAAPQEACARLNQDMLMPPSKLGIAIETSEEAALMMGLNLYPQKRFQAMVAFRRAFCRDMEAAVLLQPASSEAGQQAPVQQQPYVSTAGQQAPVQQQPYADIAGGIVPPETGKKNKKKDKKKDKQKNQEKSGKGGMVVLVVIGVILIAALGTSAFILGRNLLSGESIKADKDLEDTTGESSEDVAEGTTEENESDAVYETMLNDGDYTGVIDAITSLDIAAVSAEEKDKLCKILEQAIAGQYSDFESNVSASQNTGDYEGVFAAIEEELALYDKLSTNSWAMQYVDSQKVVDKKAAMKTAHIDYLTGDKLRAAISQGDETALKDIISKLQEYVNDHTITQEDFEDRKVSAYTNFVIEKISKMNSNGTDAAEILKYIDNNLSNTGNNCQVLEFWDYFNALLGGNRMDARVRHVSSRGYLLEDSNAVMLTNSDISHLSQYELKLAIYEIFARHGRNFSDQAVNEYFSLYDWYQPSSASFDESTLNTFEKYNLNLLVEYEISMGYRGAPEETVQESAAQEETAAVEMADWKQAYIDYLQYDCDVDYNEGYNLIYVDDDDIPELVEVGDCEATGCRIVNYADGQVHVTQMSRLYFSYIPRKNLLCNSEGHMDCYYDIVYSIIDGELQVIDEGWYGAENNANVQYDADGNPIYYFEWNGVRMTGEEYDRELFKVYNYKKAVDGYEYDNEYTLEEVIEKIRNS